MGIIQKVCYVFMILFMVSCEVSEESLLAVNKERIQGTWIMGGIERSFCDVCPVYKIEPHQITEYLYSVEEEGYLAYITYPYTMLSKDIIEVQHKFIYYSAEKSRHRITFQADGSLRISNFLQLATAVIPQYPGDVSIYQDLYLEKRVDSITWVNF